MSTARNVPVSTIGITDQEVSTAENTTGEFSDIIDIQVPKGYRYEFPTGHPITMFVPTHESFPNSGDPVTLSNDLVNSPAVRDLAAGGSDSAITGPRSLVVWDDSSDIQSDVDSVDYTANEFNYSQSNDLEVYYLWGDQGQVEFRHKTPSEEDYDKELIKQMRNFHLGDVYNVDGMISFSEPFTMMEKEHLTVTVKTDVSLTNWDAQAGDGASATPGDFETHGFPSLSIPVRRVPMKA